MNLGGYSGGGGNWLAWLILLYFLIGPYWLLWLEVRAFRHSEAQSSITLFMLIVLGLLAVYMGSDERHAFPFIRGFSEFQFNLTRIAAVIFPFALGWEAYKRGWLTMLREKMQGKKKKKKRKKVVEGKLLP
ncbi:MAG TPA: hypothetical protein PLN21_10500 [Gemmatales bacterium]|nr:hypothetical protein [Gemmatales bacterium]